MFSFKSAMAGLSQSVSDAGAVAARVLADASPSSAAMTAAATGIMLAAKGLR